MNGYLKDPYSNKDYLFSDAKPGFIKLAANANTFIINEKTSISNQSHSNSCVANATADALEILQGLNGTTVDQMSRLFIYWNSRVYTSDTDKDEGTYIRNAFDSLTTLGTCREETWAFDLNKIYVQPNLFAYKEANDNKINAFYRINGTGTSRADMVEMAVLSSHPVVFGTAVSQAFCNFYGEGIWSPPTSIVGNHAMIITGVRNNHRGREFLIRNSWGNWGDSEFPGHAWLSESYITSPLSDDFWVPTLMESLI